MHSFPDSPSPAVIPDPHKQWLESKICQRKTLVAVCEKIVDHFVHFKFNGRDSDSTDQIHKYTKQLLSLGCFYMEYSNAIQEGDGDEVLRCWRYLLPIFKLSGRKNYALEAVRLLNQYEHKLMPRQSAQLAWNRFINVHGIQGNNIPCDLHQEHLNRVCKTSIAGLGVNKTQAAVVCVGKALGTLFPVLQQFDEQNLVPENIGTHYALSSAKERDTIIHQLQESKVFSSIQSHAHRTFPAPRDVLHAKSDTELKEWIKAHI